jgi:hypothetical protein
LGHSWNYLETDKLWKFREWMTEYENKLTLNSEPVRFEVDWTGKLPYPEGEDVYKAIPDINGEPRRPNDFIK